MNLRISIWVIVTFLVARNLKYFFGYVVFGKEAWDELDDNHAVSILVYSQLLLTFFACAALFRRQALDALGLGHGFLKGLGVGLACSLPMFVGYGWMSGFEMNLSWDLLHKDMVWAGFFEEFMFRGFLFGLLFFMAGWGFLPASLLPAVFFGIGHLYQGDSASDLLGIFLFTALGSVGFSWFYIAGRNLWTLVFLHGFMDLAWEMFGIQTDVRGDLMVNVFRFTTLGLMIAWSRWQLKQHPDRSIKERLLVNNG